MIAIIILAVAVILPAFVSEDIIFSIVAFAVVMSVAMIVNPLPSTSESVLVLAFVIVAYAGAVYLTKRAVVYLSKIRFGNR